MPPSNEPPPARWGAWLRALWGNAAPIAWREAGPARPVLVGDKLTARSLLLPREIGGAAVAAAAHAAAHWRFGAGPQPRAGLAPVQQALYETLEDARVEALALRELPGLRGLWLPFHAGADAPAGEGYEALLARLARSLLEAQPADAHPWVARVRAAFLEAPPTAVAMRALASRFGHEIGQLRLPFQARTHVVHARYRDDGSWLWAPEGADLEAASAPAAAPVMAALSATQDARPAVAATLAYPEWDVRRGRQRAGWCSVRIRPVAMESAQAWPLRPLPPAAHSRVAGALERLCAATAPAGGRAATGDEFHAMALVDARVQRRLRQPPDERVYRRRVLAPRTLLVQLVLDTSASTAAPAADGWPVLRQMTAAALSCIAALESAGHETALFSFASFTRHHVEVRPLKHWSEPAAAPAVRLRCAAQASAGSTRLGTAVRHALAQVRARARERAGRPVVLVISDGEPHDIDAPDPAYLRGDLRQVLREAGRDGIPVRFLLHPWAQAGIPGLPTIGA